MHKLLPASWSGYAELSLSTYDDIPAVKINLLKQAAGAAHA